MTKKYTVITGSSTGIGRATAKAFAERGKNLVLVARRIEALITVKEELLAKYPDLDIIVKSIDLSVADECVQFFKSLEKLELETWINNAGFGHYSAFCDQDIVRTQEMIRLNVEAVTSLSLLFTQKYQDVPNTQLINVSSAGGYTIVPTAITYCATKFFVSAFTEGLARELKAAHAPMQAKVLAPAATKTEFGEVANNDTTYDYDKAFGTYHTSEEMAEFLLALYDSEETVGYVSREHFQFELTQPKFDYANQANINQKK